MRREKKWYGPAERSCHRLPERCEIIKTKTESEMQTAEKISSLPVAYLIYKLIHLPDLVLGSGIRGEHDATVS